MLNDSSWLSLRPLVLFDEFLIMGKSRKKIKTIPDQLLTLVRSLPLFKCKIVEYDRGTDTKILQVRGKRRITQDYKTVWSGHLCSIIHYYLRGKDVESLSDERILSMEPILTRNTIQYFHKYIQYYGTERIYFFYYAKQVNKVVEKVLFNGDTKYLTTYKLPTKFGLENDIYTYNEQILSWTRLTQYQ